MSRQDDAGFWQWLCLFASRAVDKNIAIKEEEAKRVITIIKPSRMNNSDGQGGENEANVGRSRIRTVTNIINNRNLRLYLESY